MKVSWHLLCFSALDQNRSVATGSDAATLYPTLHGPGRSNSYTQFTISSEDISIWDHTLKPQLHASCMYHWCCLTSGCDGSTPHNGHSSNPNGHYQLVDRSLVLAYVLAPGMSALSPRQGALWWTHIASHHLSWLIQGGTSMDLDRDSLFCFVLCVCVREIQ